MTGKTAKPYDISDANFPKDGNGRTYHTYTRHGDVANRVVTVGSHHRAKMVSSLFDTVNIHTTSDRGFETFTGTLRGVDITVIATGMGLPMVDMMVREVNASVKGPLLFLRLGTCGTPSSKIPIGSVAVSRESVLITRQYDAFHEVGAKDGKLKQSERYYYISKPIKADKVLTSNLQKELQKRITKYPVHVGVGATCDSFYGSQGRLDPNFLDHNNSLIDDLEERHKDSVSLEMETGHLLHLAKTSTNQKIRAGGCAIVLAQRRSNAFLSGEEKAYMEREAAISVLEALITTPLEIGDMAVAKELSPEKIEKYYGKRAVKNADNHKNRGNRTMLGLSLAIAAAFGFVAARFLQRHRV
ncbi:hypothetical protein AAMO2058_000553300 [Amorphochlora amoebiformis]